MTRPLANSLPLLRFVPLSVVLLVLTGLTLSGACKSESRCSSSDQCANGFVCSTESMSCEAVAGDAGPKADATASGGPDVLSISPADNATGVGPDAEIVVVFSVPMNQESVEAAWISSDLPAADLSFSWSAAGDTLTASPLDEMPIAEAEGLSPVALDPLTVGFSIGAGAADLDGQALAPFAAQFTTLRRLRVELPSVENLTNSVFNNGEPLDPPSIGAGASNFTDIFSRLLVTFDLPIDDVPSGATLERAVLSGDQEDVNGTPYSTLGQFNVQHVSFASLGLNAFSGSPLASPGTLSTSAVLETKSIDVTTEVADDFANSASRAERSQYRLQFATATVNDSTRHNVVFGSTSAAEYRSTLKLALAFLVE